MKYLSGENLVDYISERQAKQIRGLIQSKGIQPRLAIISTNSEDLPSQKYVKFKELRAQQLGVRVDIHNIDQEQAAELIQELAKDSSIHGIILQLPLLKKEQTDSLISLIPSEKDVDGMGENSLVQPATAQAILWLLTGYGIDLKDQSLLVIGKGRLVGAPLIKLLQDQQSATGLKIKSLDESNTKDELKEAIQTSDIIISATGSPGLIKSEMLTRGKQVLIDAGTAEDGGELKGDIATEVYEANLDIKITPTTGGLGPLTISCLFENLLQLIDKTAS